MNIIFMEKLQAFLHDPPDKPFILMTGEYHEARADELADKYRVTRMEESAPDHIASAMERSFLPAGASRSKELQVKYLEDPCIIHPLSGRKFQKAEELKGLDKEIFKRAVNAAMDEAWAHSVDDDKKRFLYLWRNLLPLIQKNTQDQDALATQLWPYAPADTRIPDHSIFEHLRIASACVGSTYENKMMLNNCSLFLFTIGPVQSFIAQARKAQDLYWGSYILSYLCWKAIELVCEEYGPDSIIFPDINGQPLADHWLEQTQKIDVVASNAGLVALPSIPNRFMAILPCKNKEKLALLGKSLENAVKSNFKDIGEAALGLLSNADVDIFRRQIDQFIQIYWAAYPWPDDDGEKKAWKILLNDCRPYFDAPQYGEMLTILEFAAEKGEYPLNIGNLYGMMHTLTEKALASRKNCREFEQAAEAGRKCSLCGERNIVVYRQSPKEEERKLSDAYLVNNKLFTEKAAILDSNDRLPIKYLQPGEGLCAVCFAKRTAGKYFQNLFGEEAFKVEFPSTAAIAASNVWHEESKRPYLNMLKDEIDKDFEDEKLFDKKPYTEKSEKEREIIREFEKYVKDEKYAERKKLRITPYYALMMLDGDQMGKWLSGMMGPEYQQIYHPAVWANLPDEFKQNLVGKRRQMTPAIHGAISQSLKNYALKLVSRIVEEKHHGKVVYAGGDDVMAMVSLDHLLDTMLELRGAFSGHIYIIDENYRVDFAREVSGFANIGDKLIMTMGPTASASMGVCIAHCKTPLKTVLDTARRMEKLAKDKGGRNAFAIAALRHSGQGTETVYKWYIDGQDGDGTVGCLRRLVAAIKIDPKTKLSSFSDKFIYTLHQEFSGLLNDIQDDPMVKTELKRLVERQCQMPNKTKEERAERERRINELADMLYKQVYLNSSGLKDFLSFINIAAFLARGDMR